MAVLALLILVAAPLTAASAHVTVHSDSAVAGSYAKLTFSVPTESDSASTVKLVVTLPADTPFGSVRTAPHPGWKAVPTRTTFAQPVTVGALKLTDAVTKVTWTAEPGHAIRPGEFDEFALSVGPLPAVPQVRLPAVQYYSDGSTVKWTQTTTAGAAEPEHPAPTLTIAAAAAESPDDPASSTATTMSYVAVGLGAIALVVAGVALLRCRPTGGAS